MADFVESHEIKNAAPVWYEKRYDIAKAYVALPGVERIVAGSDSRQRPSKPEVPAPPGPYQEDNIYHHNKVRKCITSAGVRVFVYV